MGNRRELVKGTIIYSFSNFLIKAGGLFILPIITRILSEDEYGALGILNTFRAILPVIAGLGLYVPQMREYALEKENKEKVGSYVFTINVFLYGLNFIILLIFMSSFGKHLFYKLTQIGDIVPYSIVIIVILISIIQVFVTLSETIMRIEKRYVLISFTSVISFFLSNILSIYFITKFNLGLYGYFIGGLIGIIFILIMYYPKYCAMFRFKYNHKEVTGSMKQGVGMVFTELIDSLIDYSDRIILLRFLNLAVVGKYTLAYTMSKSLSVVTSAFSNTWTPMFYEKVKNDKNDNYIKEALLKFFSLLFFVIIVGQLFSKPVIDLLFGIKYSEANKYIPVLLPAVGLQVFYNLDMYFHYHKESNFIPIINLIPLVLNVVINITLIPVFGGITAAWSTLISFLGRSIMSFILIKIRYNIKFPYLKFIIITIFAINPLIIKLSYSAITFSSVILKILYIVLVAIIIYFGILGMKLSELKSLKKIIK